MNWNRIKLALLLLVALWANQPVTWACGGKNKTIDPAFKIEASPLPPTSAHVARIALYRQQWQQTTHQLRQRQTLQNLQPTSP